MISIIKPKSTVDRKTTNIDKYKAKINKINTKLNALRLDKRRGSRAFKHLLVRKSKLTNKLMLNQQYLQNFRDEYWLDQYHKTHRQKVIKIVLKTTLYLFLTGYSLITLYPFIWAFFGSFRPQSEFANAALNPFPQEWTTNAYNYLFTNTNATLSQWLLNSILICIGGVVLNLILNTVAGYALARIKFNGRRSLFWIFISLTMVPAQVLMIPSYILVKNLNLINNLFALIIPSAVSIGYIFMTRQFFINLSKDIEEAAMIDGMSRFKIVFRIVFPLMRPLMITQGIFLFMGFWNSFFQASLYMTDRSNYPLTLGIQSLIQTDSYKIEYSQILAASTISIIPAVAVYASFNRLILKGQRGDGDK